ncbi:MAG: DHA2 family efflux MFS transporter permease subunit [Methylocystis sp.]|nr:DHA2 family efflux MFS transporter permease subunit [Methylocystis sp.]MBI3274586.1 DHA2 family efflux MFS transporter permease subunit [Methylocystis sp.]
MPVTDPRRLRGWRFVLLNGAIGLANVVALSNVPGYTILAPYAAANLQGVTPSFGTWATTDHMIGLALGFPIARWLAARFGGYRVYTAALVLYAVVSLFCATAEIIWSFVPARIVLGLAGGVVLPIGQALLLSEYPDQKRTLGVGIWGVLSMAPFTLGVFLGGWYAENFGWRAFFYSNVVVALTVACVVGALLYRRGFRRRIVRFDGVGFLLLAIVLLGTQTIFNQGNDFDWFESPILMSALVVVAVALPCFVIWELGERHPAIDLRLFAYRNYAVAVICSFVGFLVIQGLLSVFIVQLQVLLGYSSSLAGLVYVSMIFLAAPLVAIVHELCRDVDVRLIACLNFLGFAVTLTWIGLFDKQGYFDQIALPMTFFGFSLAAFFTPLAVLAMHGLPAARLIRAAEELTLLRTTAGAFGIALQGVVLFRRTPLHQLDLADHFGGRRFASLDLLSEFTDKLQASGFTANMAQSQLGRFIRQQAALLALNDAFLLGAVVFAALAAFVWLAYPHPVVAPTDRVETLRRAEAEEQMEQG